MEIITCNAIKSFFILHIINIGHFASSKQILRDANLLSRAPVSGVIRIHVLHLTFLVHVKLCKVAFGLKLLKVKGD